MLWIIKRLNNYCNCIVYKFTCCHCLTMIYGLCTGWGIIMSNLKEDVKKLFILTKFIFYTTEKVILCEIETLIFLTSFY